MNKIFVRIVLILLAAMMIFSCVYSIVFAAEIDEEDMTAASIILVDANTGTVLYEKNADEKRYPASTTKVLTAVIALDHLKLDQEITVPGQARTMGSTMGLVPGQVVTVETLLYGLLLSSGNDAAVTLALSICDSVEEFADLMNQKAQELGMSNSHFITASGLDTEGHMVTARDMSLAARAAYAIPALREIMATKSVTCYTVDKTVAFNMENTNLLINTPSVYGDSAPSYIYDYANGMKTGSTKWAKGCLIASASKGNMDLIAVIYGDKSKGENDRWKIAANLFDYGFSNYTSYSLGDLITEGLFVEVEDAPVVDGVPMKLECIPVSQSGNEKITLKNDVDLSRIEYTVYKNDLALVAPVSEGTELGTINIKLDGNTLVYGKLIAKEAMMTSEEYSKLTGHTIIESVIDVDGVKTSGLTKYIKFAIIVLIGAGIAGIYMLFFKKKKSNRVMKVKPQRRQPVMSAPRRIQSGSTMRRGRDESHVLSSNSRPVRRTVPSATGRPAPGMMRQRSPQNGMQRRMPSSASARPVTNIQRTAPARRDTVRVKRSEGYYRDR